MISNWKHTLRGKLTIPILLISTFLTIIISSLMIYLLVNEHIKQSTSQGKRLFNHIAFTIETSNSLSQLQRQVSILSADSTIKKLLVISNKTSNIIASSDRHNINKSYKVLPRYIIQAIEKFKDSRQLLSENNFTKETLLLTGTVYIRNPNLSSINLDNIQVVIEINNHDALSTLFIESLGLLAWQFGLVTIIIILIILLIKRIVLQPIEIFSDVISAQTEGKYDSYSPINSEDEIGQLSNAFNSMIDARKQAEAQYKSVITSAMDSIIVLNEKQNIVLFNPSAEVMFGYSSEQIIGQPLNLLIPDRFKKNHTNFVRSFKDGSSDGQKMSDRIDIFGLRSDGSEFPIQASISKTRINGQIYLTAILRDVTEVYHSRDILEKRVKERTEELTISEQRLHIAQKIANIGNWELDLKDNKLYWSKEIFRIFELDYDEFEASYEGFLNVIHPEDREMVNNAYSHSLETKEAYEITHRLLMTDGRVKYVIENCQTDYDENGNPLRSIGTVQDITERIKTLQKLEESEHQLRITNETLEHRVEERTLELKNAKDTAEKANMAKSHFLSAMSHELRTPLNAILGFTQLLDMDDITDNQRGLTLEVTSAGKHLLNLIEELLDLAKIEEGKQSTVISATNLNSVIHESITFVSGQAEQAGISITNTIPQENDDFVLADNVRLCQVLTNFLTNAIKYNRPNGDITISTWINNENDHLRICIKDTGYGIPEEQIQLAFQPFERLGASASAIEGSGIGLSLCEKLVKLMGGEIGAESIIDTGSTFWVELPRHSIGKNSTDTVTPNSERNTLDKIDKKSVLYIEDNPANVRLVTSIMQRFTEFNLITASTGNHGLELITRYKPDIVLLDINLPDLNGYDILTCIKNNPDISDTPVVALTADAMPYNIERGLKAGFYRYLTKPIDIEELLKTLSGVIKTIQK